MLNKKKIAIVLIVWLLLLGAIVKVNFVLFDKVKKTSSRLSFSKKAVEFFKKRASQLNQFGKNFPQVQSALDKINPALISKDAPVDLMNFLEKQAKQEYLSLEVTPSGGLSKKGDWESLSFTIKTKGKFPGTIRFLKNLEYGSFFVEVFGADIKRVEEKSKEGKVQKGDAVSSFNIRVFSKNKKDETN